MQEWVVVGSIATLVALAGGIIGIASTIKNLKRNARMDTVDDIAERSAMKNDLKNIMVAVTRTEKSVDKIDTKLDGEVQRINGRIDTLSSQVLALQSELSSAVHSSKSCHHRLTEHLERQHQIAVEKRSDWN